MYTYTTTIRLHDTDAAGTVFFGSVFRIAHDAYEEFLNSNSLGIGNLLREKQYARYIVHSEADFKGPLFVGDQIDVTVSAVKIGDSSYTIGYNISKEGSKTPECTAKTVHVCVDVTTKKPVSIPGSLRNILEEIAV